MHFTYEKAKEGEDLQQGDILSITPALAEIIASIHPAYAGEKNVAYIVLSQSCDLVRRSSQREECKTPYIEIAAVRKLDFVLARYADQYRDQITRAAGAISRMNQRNIEEFIMRLLNNNETEYFYLHKDNENGISDRWCALLRLSIPLKSNIHYSKLVDARLLSLTPAFQAKLGWLVGNMYGRVGTEDWLPDKVTQEEWKKLIADIVEGNLIWLDEEKIKAKSKELKGRIAGMSPEAIRKEVAEATVTSKKEQIIEEVLGVFSEFGKDQGVEEEAVFGHVAIKKIRQRLRNSVTLASLTKSR